MPFKLTIITKAVSLIEARKITDKAVDEYTNIYNMYYSLIFSSIYSKVNNFHEAEDICQEVFIRLYNKFEEVDDPRKWLYGALRIVVLDYYKEKSKKDISAESNF